MNEVAAMVVLYTVVECVLQSASVRSALWRPFFFFFKPFFLQVETLKTVNPLRMTSPSRFSFSPG